MKLFSCVKSFGQQKLTSALVHLGTLIWSSMKLSFHMLRRWLGQRHQILITGAAGLVFVVIAMSATVAKNHVTIYDDGEIYYRYTDYIDQAEILEDCEITLTPHDEYAIAVSEQESKVTVMIKRAFPVSVTADGSTTKFEVTGGTVEQMLQRANLTYTEDDLINFSLDQQVESSQEIVLQRVTYQETIEKEPVDFEKKRPTGPLPKNMKEQVVQPGKSGERTIKKKTKYIDGIEDETIVLSDDITIEPRTEVVKYVQSARLGVSELKYDPDDVLLDENGIPINYKYKVNGKASAYSALGKPTKLVPGCVAMDFSKFPKGTRLYIRTPDGSYIYGYSKVADTGSFVHNGSGVLVDLFFNSYAESARFGIKNVDVYVLD